MSSSRPSAACGRIQGAGTAIVVEADAESAREPVSGARRRAEDGPGPIERVAANSRAARSDYWLFRATVYDRDLVTPASPTTALPVTLGRRPARRSGYYGHWSYVNPLA